jgi:phosphopentomutase
MAPAMSNDMVFTSSIRCLYENEDIRINKIADIFYHKGINEARRICLNKNRTGMFKKVWS